MNIAVLCSGSGTNLQAIIDAVKSGYIKSNLAVVISDNPDAYALVRAQKAKIETLVIDKKGFKARQEYDRELVGALEKRSVNLVVLAGFMRLLSPYFVDRFPNSIMNIHPALLPSFRGTDGVKDAFDYGVKITGPTVHFVTKDLDAGPIILQKAVEIEDGDTKETLLERVHKAEHEIYPEAIKLFVEGRLKIEGRKVKKIK